MRWWKFNAVGLMGAGVQMAALALFVHAAGLHYLAATVLAVEAAVLHNFLWHCRWTWGDRRRAEPLWVVGSLARFHAGNGLVSLVGNVACMRLLVGTLALHPIPANLLSILVCALLNFLLADRFVFPAPARTSGGARQSGCRKEYAANAP
jgi:dolichol-phosphate mannosyltransferase